MFKATVKKILSLIGVKLTLIRRPLFPVEFSPEDIKIFEYVRKHELSIVSDERLFSTLMACAHVVTNKIEGDFVECGAYRGGNGILAADYFQRTGTNRIIWLFDTFTGMSAPTDLDVNYEGNSAKTKFLERQRDGFNDWMYATIEDVKENFSKAALLNSNVRFIKGDVLETLKRDSLPEKISVLRLDTDWYESTKLELEVCYPRLSSGGILIVDDYGSWGGAKKAVDEYFSTRPRPFFQYCDFSRVGVKID